MFVSRGRLRDWSGIRALNSSATPDASLDSMTRQVPRLWHATDAILYPSAVVPPNLFGKGVMAGGAHPPQPFPSYFFREYMFELVRATRTTASVSRLTCTFAFESEEHAALFAATHDQAYYEVAPANPDAPISRHDMEWVSRAGAPNTTPGTTVEAIERYWSGESAPSDTVWEWLSSSGLRVV